MSDNLKELINDGTKWLFEMHLLDNPQIKNTLIMNIFRSSPNIKNLDVLSDTEHKKMLIYLELTWWAKLWKKEQETADGVLDMLTGVLPGFKFRVIFDKTLFIKATDMAEKLIKDRGYVES